MLSKEYKDKSYWWWLPILQPNKLWNGYLNLKQLTLLYSDITHAFMYLPGIRIINRFLKNPKKKKKVIKHLKCFRNVLKLKYISGKNGKEMWIVY